MSAGVGPKVVIRTTRAIAEATQLARFVQVLNRGALFSRPIRFRVRVGDALFKRFRFFHRMRAPFSELLWTLQRRYRGVCPNSLEIRMAVFGARSLVRLLTPSSRGDKRGRRTENDGGD